jgi:altronate dehydratase small subunit
MPQRTKAIALSIKDNVATALAALKADATVVVEIKGRIDNVQVLSDIPMGHKFALLNLEPGAPVIKYGEPIGRATARIVRGEHVHVHNVTGGKRRGQ